MRKLVLLLFVFVLSNSNAQKKPTMNNDTIKISDNISLFQKKEKLIDPLGIFWELCISNKKEKKEILLETSRVNERPSIGDFHVSNDFF